MGIPKCRVESCKGNGAFFLKMMSGRNFGEIYRYCLQHAEGLVQCPSLAKEVTEAQYFNYIKYGKIPKLRHSING